MTITAELNRIVYSGNGTTVAFAVPFPFIANGDLTVYLRSSVGVETLQVITSQYTVTGAGVPAGGTVTFLSPPTTGTTVVIYRDPPITQTQGWNDSDPDPAATRMLAFDKRTMVEQRLDERANRSIHLSDGDTQIDLALPSSTARASKAYGFDATGLPTMLTITGGATVTEATNITYDPPGTGSDNRTVADWLDDKVSVFNFIPPAEHAAIRAKTSTYDCSADVQDAVNFAAGRRVFFPAGKYKFLSQVNHISDGADQFSTAWTPGMKIVGEGSYVTIFDHQVPRSVLTNAFSTVNLSSTVTVNHTAHGYEAGEMVTFEDATTVGGLAMEGSWEIDTIVDANTYTFIYRLSGALSTATSTVNNSGSANVVNALFRIDVLTFSPQANVQSGCEFKGFTMETNAATLPNSVGIQMRKAFRVDIEDVTVEGNSKIVDAFRVVIANNALTGDRDGCNQILFRKVRVDSCPGWGAQINGGQHTFTEVSFTRMEQCIFQACGTMMPTTAITGISIASPAVVTAPGHTFVNGDEIRITGVAAGSVEVAGASIVNGQVFTVQNVVGNNFDLTVLGSGVNFSTAAATAWAAGGGVAAWPPTSGCIKWRALILQIVNSATSVARNVGLLIPIQGTANSLTIQGFDFENTNGQSLIIRNLRGATITDIEFLNNNTNPASHGMFIDASVNFVTDIDVNGAKVRASSGNNHYTAFFQSAGAGRKADGVRIKNIFWTDFDYTGQKRFDGIEFNHITASAELFAVSAQVLRLRAAPHGNKIPLKDVATGEWREREINSVTQAQSISTASTLGLSPNTVYNVFVFDDAGTLRLDVSTVTFTSDSVAAYQVKTGNEARLFVGAVRTTPTSAGSVSTLASWPTDNDSALIRSWLTPRPKVLRTVTTAILNTTSTSFVHLGPLATSTLGLSSLQNYFVALPGDRLDVTLQGSVSGSSTGQIVQTAVGLDSTAIAQDAIHQFRDPIGTTLANSTPLSLAWSTAGLATGEHYVTLLGLQASTTTAAGYWLGGASPERTTLTVRITPRSV